MFVLFPLLTESDSGGRVDRTYTRMNILQDIIHEISPFFLTLSPVKIPLSPFLTLPSTPL